MILVGHKILAAKIRELFLNESIILKNEFNMKRLRIASIFYFTYIQGSNVAKMLLFVSFVKCSFQ